MLGVVAFLVVCVIAAYFPVATTLIVLGIVAVLTAQHVIGRWQGIHRK